MDQQPTQPNDQNIIQPAVAPAETKPKVPPTPSIQTSLNPTSTNQTPSSNFEKNKKVFILAIGIIFLVIVLTGSILYVTGVLKRAERLTSKPPVQKNIQKPTIQVQLPEKSAEEIEAESVDTGDPASDITELENDASSL